MGTLRFVFLTSPARVFRASRDAIESYGFWGWRRNRRLVDWDVEENLDRLVDELLSRLLSSRGVAPTVKIRIEQTQAAIALLREQRVAATAFPGRG